jgi:hypothetical protein
LPWTTQLDHQVFLHSNSSLTISNSATWSLKTRAWHVLLLIFFFFFFFQMTMTISDREREREILFSRLYRVIRRSAVGPLTPKPPRLFFCKP